MKQVHPDTMAFFKDLAVNNNRDWFMANKERWNVIHGDFVDFTASLIDAMSVHDSSLRGADPRKCVYRIYRDVRFSLDKSPYKRHIACFLPSGGIKKCGVPGYYLQLGMDSNGLPAGCSLGGGIFMPDPDALAAVRQEIYYNIDEFLSIIRNPTYRSYYGDGFFTIKKLSRAPKGYPNDWEYADYLKYKDYTTMCVWPDSVVNEADFFEKVVEAFCATVPLNKFIQKAMYQLL